MKTQADPLKLPGLALDALNVATKDFLLAKSASTGKPIKEVMQEALTEAATQAGFPPDPPSPHHGHEHKHAA